jgi:hypothetical protein
MNKYIMSEELQVPTEFTKVIRDFTNDLIRTFPDKITESSANTVFLLNRAVDANDTEQTNKYYTELHIFCKEVYPKYFFDILYENKELFDKETTELLPNVNFVELWKSDITDATKSTIWKYLQLILFTVITDVNSEESFGDTAKLFEAINTDEFKQKIEATIGEMETIFKQKAEEDGVANEEEPPQMEIPKAEELHDHINKMMEGKLGCLAKEIAGETAETLDIDMGDATSVNDVFNKLFRNPAKLMDLVKNVGSKLDSKIKSGAIKETELLEEATEFVANMKNMPGMNNLESMFSKMGIPGMGAGAKVDMNAFNQQMQQNLRGAKMRDRMRSKLDQKKQASESEGVQVENPEGTIRSKGINQLGMEELVYSFGESIEKSTSDNRKKKKKAKGKKK